MDNRRFLYCGMTELWGHIRKAEAGNGKPGKQGTNRLGKSGQQWEARCGAKTSSEVHEPCIKKRSRYCLYRTRTVNRHRWMRRES